MSQKAGFTVSEQRMEPLITWAGTGSASCLLGTGWQLQGAAQGGGAANPGINPGNSSERKEQENKCTETTPPVLS